MVWVVAAAAPDEMPVFLHLLSSGSFVDVCMCELVYEVFGCRIRCCCSLGDCGVGEVVTSLNVRWNVGLLVRLCCVGVCFVMTVSGRRMSVECVCALVCACFFLGPPRLYVYIKMYQTARYIIIIKYYTTIVGTECVYIQII